MQKLYSSIIGTAVFDESSGAPIALVRDLIVDPENGKLLAFLLQGERIIVPMDVERITNGIYIRDRDRIVPVNEVLRVFGVHKKCITIINAQVITERDKKHIGRVIDYEIDTTHMILTRLFVAKTFFFFHFQESIIQARHIVKIDKNIIIVRNLREPLVKEKTAVRSSAFAA